jgi:hypothetical protein
VKFDFFKEHFSKQMNHISYSNETLYMHI